MEFELVNEVEYTPQNSKNIFLRFEFDPIKIEEYKNLSVEIYGPARNGEEWDLWAVLNVDSPIWDRSGTKGPLKLLLKKRANSSLQDEVIKIKTGD